MNEIVLVFAPHNDDEVLGVGGTIAKYAATGNKVVICEVTSSLVKERLELIRKEAQTAHDTLGVSESIFLDLPVVKLNEITQRDITGKFSEVVKKVDPTIVFIPHIGDMHTDHRIVTDTAMVALRPLAAPRVKAIFMYETLSETEWNIPSTTNAFMPNAWSDISDYLNKKLVAMNSYQCQLKEAPHPRSLWAVEALAHYRGSTIGVQAAEAFVQVRSIF